MKREDKLKSTINDLDSYGTHIPKPIYLQEIKQYGPGSSHENGKRRLDEVILQNIEGVGDDDRCAENGEEYQEVGRRSEYNNNGSRRIRSNDKHQ